MLAASIDSQLVLNPPEEGWIKRGTPLVPKVSLPAPLVVDRHSRPFAMSVQIDYPNIDDLIVFTVDIDVARIDDRRTLLFYPSRPGVHQFTIIAVTPLNVVGSATVRITVGEPPFSVPFTHRLPEDPGP